MNILLCNPRNSQGTKHSRKGMYPPLGMLSIHTFLTEALGDAIHIDICDEDVEVLTTGRFRDYDLVGFYATTFNYAQAVRYAYMAKEYDCITVLGGPHPTVLAKNILKRRNCFDYIIQFEAEYPFLKLIKMILDRKDNNHQSSIPNLAFKDRNGHISIPSKIHVNRLTDLPIPSRAPVNHDLYVENYRKIYPDRPDSVPGSIYSSKGCSWRDRTGGCIFCARLEEGLRFRDIDQIWTEIEMLKDMYGVNSIWDIADDNLNNRDWFIDFVKKRPKSCAEMKFFIYSRANCIKEWMIKYFHELNVEEVFLGIESGDNRLLKEAFKGQTRKQSFQAMKLLSDSHIQFYPSFVLGLPGESIKSLDNTLNLCRDIAEMGGLD
ncbi:MAG TPA: radical SAM protein, partial [Desulfobacteraceae bacterium]|nr:radical SAM protein [Desulfobacteraceae bacterium]